MCQYYTIILYKSYPRCAKRLYSYYACISACTVGRSLNQCGTNDLKLHESQLGTMCGYVFVLRIRRYGKEFANRANGVQSCL